MQEQQTITSSTSELNMNLPFEHVSYQRYKNTFLNTVMLILPYPQVSNDDHGFYNRFKDYVKSFFGIDLPEGEFKEGAALNKGDGSISINFTKDQVNIIMSGQKYETFTQSMLPNVFNLRSFFKNVVKIDKIERITLRKINVWNFKNEKNVEVTGSGTRAAVFSTSLLEALSKDNLTDQEAEMPDMMKCEWNDDNESLTIRSAFNKTDEKDGFSQLILDTEYCVSKHDGFKLEDIANELLHYNSTLYQAYHWCVNDKVKNLMNH